MNKFFSIIFFIVIILMINQSCIHGRTRILWDLVLNIYQIQNSIASNVEKLVYKACTKTKLDYKQFEKDIANINISNLKFYLSGIEYREESIDIASLPIVTFYRRYGDCDDYSRLAAHILGKLGYRAYIIDLYKVNEKFGHSICIAIKNQEVVLVDNQNVYREVIKGLALTDNLIVQELLDVYSYTFFALRDKDLNLMDIEWIYNF